MPPTEPNGEFKTMDRVRIDKWLWAVRLYKSRSLAAAACLAGHVKVGGQRVKPARDARPGEIITALTGSVTRTIKVLALLDRRVSATLASQYREDLTPSVEPTRNHEHPLGAVTLPTKGSGRPTKKQRRQWDRHFG